MSKSTAYRRAIWVAVFLVLPRTTAADPVTITSGSVEVLVNAGLARGTMAGENFSMTFGADGFRAAIALVLEDDLGQRDRREVFPARRVDHGDLAAGANHLLDLLERHVAALLRVVQLTVGVPLDDVRHRAREFNTARQACQQRPC